MSDWYDVARKRSTEAPRGRLSSLRNMLRASVAIGTIGWLLLAAGSQSVPGPPPSVWQVASALCAVLTVRLVVWTTLPNAIMWSMMLGTVGICRSLFYVSAGSHDPLAVWLIVTSLLLATVVAVLLVNELEGRQQ